MMRHRRAPAPAHEGLRCPCRARAATGSLQDASILRCKLRPLHEASPFSGAPRMTAFLKPPVAAPLRVLVADDSTLMRKLIGSIVRQCPALELAGEACDGLDALEKASTLDPDVILLDIEMPHLDGLGFLAAARLRTAAQVIVVSSLAEPGSGVCRRALALGAVDIVAKPSGVVSLDIAERRGADLLDAILRCGPRPLAD